MPVDPGHGERLARRVSDLYADAELSLLRRIARALAQGTDSPQWATLKLAQLDWLRASMGQDVTLLDVAAVAGVRQVITEAFQTGQALAVTDLDGFGVEVRMPPARAFAIERVAEETLGRVRTVGVRLLRSVTDIYQQVVAEASGTVLLGANTRRDAAQQALDRLTTSGVRGFTDTAGRTWTADTYVEMAVRTGTGNAAVQGHVDQLAANGLDLVMVSDSPRECKLCRPWEGKVLSIGGTVRGVIEAESLTSGRPVKVTVAASLAQARSDGLMHPNCRHSVSAYLPGASRLPTRTRDTDERVAQEQRQRAIERHIRDWKRRAAVALTPEAEKAANARVRQWQAALRDHLATTDLPRKSAREQIGRAH